jgi:hypothetical protein
MTTEGFMLEKPPTWEFEDIIIIDCNELCKVRSDGELPYFHYTLYQDHLNIRLHNSCKEINSDYEDYRFFKCKEVKANSSQG